METDSGTYGDRIRKVRKMLGLTQEELAAMIPCDRTTLGAHERSETPLENTAIPEALARLTGYSVDYFLGIEPTPNPLFNLNDNPSDHDLLRLLCSLGYSFKFISFSQVDTTRLTLSAAHFQTEGAILSFSSVHNLAIIDGIKTPVLIDSVCISHSGSNESSENAVVSYTEFSIILSQITGFISHFLSPDRISAESGLRDILTAQDRFLFKSTPIGFGDKAPIIATYENDREEQAQRRRKFKEEEEEDRIRKLKEEISKKKKTTPKKKRTISKKKTQSP